MSKSILLALGAVLLGASAAAASPADGLWRAPLNHAEIEVYDCGESLCGRVVDSDNLKANPDERDVHNRDPALRGRSMKGLVMLSGFKGGPNDWLDGRLYDPSTGNVYTGDILVKDPDTLVLKGCLIKPFCLSQTWKRIR